MKSSAHNLGNLNMRGKKYKLLSCRCCEAHDLREKEIKKQLEKEIRNFIEYKNEK